MPYESKSAPMIDLSGSHTVPDRAAVERERPPASEEAYRRQGCRCALCGQHLGAPRYAVEVRVAAHAYCAAVLEGEEP